MDRQTAPDVVDGDFQMVKHADQSLEIGTSSLMSPAALREQIAQDRELRQILKKYVEDEMVEGHHYFYMSRVSNPNADRRPGEKAALMQDGAFMFLNLFKYTPGTVRKNIMRTEDGHFTVEAEAPIFNGNGRLVATGDGSCSTRETKYAYRKGERLCPTCEQPAIRKDRNPGGGWYCWAKIGGCGAKFAAGDTAIEMQNVGRIENPDLADVENTVLKMAVKRATVAAVRKLPLVSELFSGESPDGDSNDRPAPKTEPQKTTRSTKSATTKQAPVEDDPFKPQQAGSQSLPLDDPKEVEQLRSDVQELLSLKIGDEAGDREAFLNGRNPEVMLQSALVKMKEELAAM